MLVWHVDAGHAWLKVPIADYPGVLAYGTGYGYFDGVYAYLEEDVEASAFLNAHEELFHASIRVVNHLDEAPCRKLPRIPSVVVVR